MECSICMCNINSDNIITECNHNYHKSCLDDWLVKNDGCPYCRKNLKPEREIRRNKIIDVFSDVGVSIVKLCIEIANRRHASIYLICAKLIVDILTISQYIKIKLDFNKILYIELFCFTFTIFSSLYQYLFLNFGVINIIASSIYLFFVTTKMGFNFVNILTETKLDILAKITFSTFIVIFKMFYLPLYLIFKSRDISNCFHFIGFYIDILHVYTFYMDILYLLIVFKSIGILYNSPIFVLFQNKIRNLNYN